MYTVWIKIDETLPWVELKRAYETRREARKGLEDFLKSLQVKIVSAPDKRNPLRAIAPLRTKH